MLDFAPLGIVANRIATRWERLLSPFSGCGACLDDSAGFDSESSPRCGHLRSVRDAARAVPHHLKILVSVGVAPRPVWADTTHVY